MMSNERGWLIRDIITIKCDPGRIIDNAIW